MGGVLLKIGDALDRKLQQVHCKITRLLLLHAFYGLPISALYDLGIIRDPGEFPGLG
jgi:hypothetical protein